MIIFLKIMNLTQKQVALILIQVRVVHQILVVHQVLVAHQALHRVQKVIEKILSTLKKTTNEQKKRAVL